MKPTSPFWLSLKTRVTLLSLAIFLIGIWSLAYYSGRILQNNLQHLQGEQQFSTASIVAAEINQEIDFRLSSLKQAAKEIPPTTLNNSVTTQAFMEDRLLLRNLFNGGLFVARGDGTIIADVPRSTGRIDMNVSEKSWMREALQGKSAIGKPVIDKKLQVPVLTMATPIRNHEGSVVGVLAGVIDLSKPNFLDNITNIRYGKTGGYLLVAPQYRLFITGTDKNRIMQPTPAPGINQLYDRYAAGFEGYGVVVDARGVKVLSSAKKIPAAGWFVVTRIPTKEAFAPIHKMQQNMQMAAIILTVLAGGLTWWMLRRQLSPMLDAVAVLSALSESNLPVTTLPIIRQDEVGQLIGAFNGLLESLAMREAKLIESEEHHRSILQTSMSGIWLADIQGRLLEVNMSYCQMSGYSEQELLAMNIADLDINESESEVIGRIRLIRELGETRFESQHRRKDGTVFDVEVSVQYRPVDGGQCVAFLEDITAHKMSEVYRRMGQDILLVLNEKEYLKEAIQRVIGLVKAVTGVDAVGIRLQDEDDFPYFYQDGFPQDFLQKENSLLNRAQDGGICRDDCGNICLECTCGLVISGKTDPSSPLFTSGGSAWTNDSFQFLHVPSDEDPRTSPRNECIHQGFASIALIPIRAKGGIVGLLQLNDHRKGRFTLELIETLEEIAENIGEAMLRKQAEEKLIASERFLRTLTDNLPGMVGYWTNELCCSFANKAYLEWFGKTSEQMAGIAVKELMGDELFSKNEPYMRRTLQGEPQHFERALVKPTGETGYTWAHYVPDVVDGTVRGCFVLISDITELKRAEEEKGKLEAQLQQAQKMESVGSLAGGVAHDFNNKLSVILGCTYLASAESDPAQLQMFLEEIRKAAEQSADLTRQLLAFARRQTIAPRVLDLNEIVASMLKMLQRLIGEDILLAWQPAPDLWLLKFDPAQVDQILANLCVNARDSITDGGTITIATGNDTFDEGYCARHVDASPGDYVWLAVSDNGCGMNKETLDRIFEPFFTTKEQGKGTGLGLATVFGIVKQNNGFIDVNSKPGVGTAFTIYLPRYGDTSEMALKENTTMPAPRGLETILLVEDELPLLNMATMILANQGYTVLQANTPAEAIRLAKEYSGAIKLLITDVIMPEMNGRNLADDLKTLNPQLKCLFMSGYTADAIAKHGVLDEDVNFIQKPFSLPDLATKTREVLDGTCRNERD